MGRWHGEAVVRGSATPNEPSRSTRDVCRTLSEPSNALPGTSRLELCLVVAALVIIDAVMRTMEELIRLLPLDAVDVGIRRPLDACIIRLDHGEVVQLAFFNNVLR